MTSTASRTIRLLTAAAITTTLLPAAGALAQPATPTPSTTTTPAPAPTRPQTTVSARTIDVGSTVALDVRGTPGQVVDLLASTARSGARVIRTTTLDADGRAGWTLRPGETTSFVVRPRGTGELGQSGPVTVTVRRTVTIGIRQADGVYTFTGTIARLEAGVQVTIARLDGRTGRVTGVASTRTTADGRYEIRTALPTGLDGYYSLTSAQSGLDAGRSRLYGLLVNTRPAAPAQTRITRRVLDVTVRS